MAPKPPGLKRRRFLVESSSDDESHSENGMDMDDKNPDQAIGIPDDDPEYDHPQPKPSGLKRRRLYVEPSEDEIREGMTRCASPPTYLLRELHTDMVF